MTDITKTSVVTETFAVSAVMIDGGTTEVETTVVVIMAVTIAAITTAGATAVATIAARYGVTIAKCASVAS